MKYIGFNFDPEEPAGIGKLISMRFWLKEVAGDISGKTWFWVKESVSDSILEADKGIPSHGIVIKDPEVATLFGIMFANDLV